MSSGRSIYDRMTPTLGAPRPGEFRQIARWSRMSEEERDQVIFALLDHLKLDAYLVNGGSTVSVVLENYE